MFGISVEAGHYHYRVVNNQPQLCAIGYSNIDSDGRADALSSCNNAFVSGRSLNSHSLWVYGVRYDDYWYQLDVG
jgi:hypothetical protein